MHSPSMKLDLFGQGLLKFVGFTDLLKLGRYLQEMDPRGQFLKNVFS
jgi:hypothetical protein